MHGLFRVPRERETCRKLTSVGEMRSWGIAGLEVGILGCVVVSRGL